jgi:Ca2+-binding EF-hand superfamily protein
MSLSLQTPAKTLTASNSEQPSFSISTAAMKRRRCVPLPATQQTFQYHHNHYHRHSFSTTTKSTGPPSATAAVPDKLPSSATTGNIAGHKQDIPTERDIAMAGGVWAVTSAKRDKLGELKNALGEDHDTLDDLATEDEVLDLHLADGIKLITKVTDSNLEKDNDDDDVMKVLNEFSVWLGNQQNSDDPSQPNEINRTELGIKLELVSAKLESLLETVPSDRCLRNIRDFLYPGDISEELKYYKGEDNPLSSDNKNNNLSMDTARFWDSVTRYRLLLAKSAIDHLLESWKMFTTVSDADIDRAAAEGIALQSELDTVSLDKVIGFLQMNVSGSCSDRFTAAWDLMDRDQDGSLDEQEMHQVARLCLAIEVDAMQTLFEETLDAFPVRAPLAAMGSDDDILSAAAPKGWRQKRAEKNTKKKLIKMFQKNCKKHFDVEVEVDHRLRCMYAWANKADQDNQLKSVLVDEQVGWTGRKRYVELSPKISEAEFREVQGIHFKHLTRLGSEIAESFREDLWVLQGKRRERKDLIRNSFLFLAGVSAIDYVIIML